MAENNEAMLKTKLKNKEMDDKLTKSQIKDIKEQNDILKDEVEEMKEQLCDKEKIERQLNIQSNNKRI